MTDIDWNEALKGWEVKFSHDGPGARWFVSKPSGYCSVVTCREIENHVVSDLLVSMASAPIYTPKESSPWTGDGLPPVGVEVEWHECQQTGWQRVTVLAYHGDEAWIAPAGKPSIVVGNPANFRPIRTPEQIAEEERKAAIDEMYRIYADQPVATHNVRECLAAIYDSGWRKQEAV